MIIKIRLKRQLKEKDMVVELFKKVKGSYSALKYAVKYSMIYNIFSVEVDHEKEIMQYHLLMQPCFDHVVCMWKERTGKSH